MEKRLTKKLIKKYDIVIESGIVECPLLKSFTGLGFSPRKPRRFSGGG